MSSETCKLAETDPRERAFIEFCRNLARSRPRPSRSARERLMGLGYSRPEVAEMAFVISLGCFYNRVSTLIACPPETKFERMANGPVGRLIGLAVPCCASSESASGAHRAPPRPQMRRSPRGRFGADPGSAGGLACSRRHEVRARRRVRFQRARRSATKALMFAVIARTLGARTAKPRREAAGRRRLRRCARSTPRWRRCVGPPAAAARPAC